MDTARHLRRVARRIVPSRFEKPKGLDALVSLSHGYRRDKEWQRHRARRAADDAARRDFRRAWANNPDNPTLTAARRAELLAGAE